jgi:hypothetical protein
MLYGASGTVDGLRRPLREARHMSNMNSERLENLIPVASS